MLKFGDIFKYQEFDYVYLSLVDQNLYAAKILSPKESLLIKEQYERTQKNIAKRNSVERNSLYCFTILSTKGYQDQMAHFKTAQSGQAYDDTILPSNQAVNIDDLKEILKTIRDKNSPLPIQLKESLKDVSIN